MRAQAPHDARTGDWVTGTSAHQCKTAVSRSNDSLGGLEERQRQRCPTPNMTNTAPERCDPRARADVSHLKPYSKNAVQVYALLPTLHQVSQVPYVAGPHKLRCEASAAWRAAGGKNLARPTAYRRPRVTILDLSGRALVTHSSRHKAVLCSPARAGPLCPADPVHLRLAVGLLSASRTPSLGLPGLIPAVFVSGNGFHLTAGAGGLLFVVGVRAGR